MSIRAIRLGDALYPERVRELRDAPDPIYWSGDSQPLNPAVAVVGARAASERGQRIAFEIAAGLARAGVCVVSGGARGVDAAAHQGALSAGGRTIAVLPSPLSNPYPRRQRPLFDAILRGGGALVSEHETPPRFRSAFLMRNRIVAALAELVVVVEAGARSGTRHTVGAARRLARTIAAVPWAVGDPGGETCVENLCRGAHAVRGAADVLRLLGRPAPRTGPVRPAPVGDLPAEQRAILDAICAAAPEPPTPAQLARILGAPLATVLSALTMLEVEGRVASRGGVFYAAGALRGSGAGF